MKHIHSLGIIHRDLKPENILICDGNVAKLTDFGWAVHTSKDRKTFCGTIDYIGPEILRREGYTSVVDLWTIGVLAFELSAGEAPFQSNNREITSKRIKVLNYTTPEHFSPELVDFVKRLLTLSP